MKMLRVGAALILLVLAGGVSLGAQTHFASFTGTAVDKDGKPVPDVEVVATNVATQVAYTARSNDAGPLHDHGSADRHVQDSCPGTRISSHTRRTRSRLSQGRTRGSTSPCRPACSENGRSHRHHPDPADPGRRRRRSHLGDDHRAHAAQRPQLLPARRCCCRAS